MTKLMLVEDDNNLREIYGARLQAEGYEIVSAKDGEEALALAVKERPDLIISDVMMPKISGFDMRDILRSTTETKHTKVIMMTALSQKEDQERGEKLGADRYLVKSQVTLEDVVNVVSEVLTDSAPAAEPTPEPAAPAPVPDTTPAPAPEPTPVVPPVVPAPVPDPTPAPAPEPAVAPAPVTEPTPEPAAPAPVPDPTPAPAPEPTPVVPPVVPAPVPDPTPAPAPEPAVAPAPVTEPTPEPAQPAAPAAPGGAVPDPKPEAPATTAPEPTTQPTTSPSSSAPEQTAPSATQVPAPTPEPVAAPAPVVAEPAPEPAAPDVTPEVAVAPPTETVETPEVQAEETEASAEEKEPLSPAKRKGKVIKPISDPDDKPNINELLAKEESVQAGGIVTPESIQTNDPAPQPAADDEMPLQPPADAPPVPDQLNQAELPDLPEIAGTGAETVAEEKSEVDEQIQAFIDSQTAAVESGDDPTPPEEQSKPSDVSL